MDWTRIDGAERQAVAARLWSAWRDGTHRAGLVVGFSGVGKSEKLAGALIAAAGSIERPAVRVDTPPAGGIDGHGALIAELAGEAADALVDPAVTAAVRDAASLTDALKALVRAGALVVIDDIQLQCDPASGAPPSWLDKAMMGLADPDPRRGWVLLLSNRAVAEVDWVERCQYARFHPPAEDMAAARAIIAGASLDAVALLGDRIEEAIRRLGANPRALGLLARQLDYNSLDELLGPAEPGAGMVSEPGLIEPLERRIIERAAERLDPDSRDLMLRLSVVRGAAPAGLVDALGHGLDVPTARQALRGRMLLAPGAPDRLNPVAVEVGRARLGEDPAAWVWAHKQAGAWYARPLVKGMAGRLEAYVGPLSAALYHLDPGRGADPGLRGRVLAAARKAVFGAFNWTASNPANAQERDAQIDLLRAVLDEPPPAVEYHLAKLLLARGAPGDLGPARDHARRGAEGSDDFQPWVLWVQATRTADGLEAAVVAGEAAIKRVDPAKNPYPVYQLLGAALIGLGRTAEAIERLWQGFQRDSQKYAARLVEQALYCAAAAAEPAPLAALRAKVESVAELGPKLALGRALAAERRGDWAGAAQAAAEGRAARANYLHLALHEALGWLGDGRPDAAAYALDRFPNRWRLAERVGAAWLFAAVHLQRGDVERAAELFETYIGAAGPRDPAALRAALLHEWDTRVGTVSEANPALIFPILPPALTGLPGIAIRPQHGPPVLPAHITAPPPAPAAPHPGPPAVAGEEATVSAEPIRLPKNLIEAYAAGRLIPFVGSGLSHGLPGWWDVPGALLDICDDLDVWPNPATAERIRGLLMRRGPDGGWQRRPLTLDDMLRHLDEVKTRLGSRYPAALKAVFDPADAEPNPLHGALAALAAPAILTTNYDRLIEFALPRSSAYTQQKADSALADLQRERPVIFKVHGTALDHTSVVLTLSEYTAAQADERYQRVLGHLLAAHSFLFVGFGHVDPHDLDLALRAHTKLLGEAARTHYSLLKRHSGYIDPQQNAQADVDLAARLWSEYRIKVLWYDAHEQVLPTLQALASGAPAA